MRLYRLRRNPPPDPRDGHDVVNVDKMTYAASEEALEEARRDARHVLIRADMADGRALPRSSWLISRTP